MARKFRTCSPQDQLRFGRNECSCAPVLARSREGDHLFSEDHPSHWRIIRGPRSLQRSLVASASDTPLSSRAVTQNPASRRSGFESGALVGRDSGASLVLALVFLVVVSLIVISLATWTSANLSNTIRFNAAQSMVSAANSATELAVQNVRYDFEASTINQWTPVECLAPTGQFQQNNQTVSVWCRTRWNFTNINATRVVTFWTCPGSTFSVTCATQPLVQAIVSYNDYPQSGTSSNCLPVSTSTTSTTTTTAPIELSCGAGMKIDSWVFGAVAPFATSVSSAVANSSCASGQSFTINGSNFTGPATVNLVSTTLPASASPSAPVLAVVSSSQITACVPTYFNGTTWNGTAYVVVSTPTGVSFDPGVGGGSTAGPVFTYP